MIISLVAAIICFGCGIICAVNQHPILAIVDFSFAAINVAAYLL